MRTTTDQYDTSREVVIPDLLTSPEYAQRRSQCHFWCLYSDKAPRTMPFHVWVISLRRPWHDQGDLHLGNKTHEIGKPRFRCYRIYDHKGIAWWNDPVSLVWRARASQHPLIERNDSHTTRLPGPTPKAEALPVFCRTAWRARFLVLASEICQCTTCPICWSSNRQPWLRTWLSTCHLAGFEIGAAGFEIGTASFEIGTASFETGTECPWKWSEDRTTQLGCPALESADDSDGVGSGSCTKVSQWWVPKGRRGMKSRRGPWKEVWT